MKALAPSTFLMSQSMSESKASTLAPLQVMASFSSLIRWMSCAWSARKTSPVPVIFISLVPSPRHGLLEHAAHAAGAGVLEAHVALVAHHRAGLGLDRDLVEADLEQLRVLEGERLLALGFLELTEGALHLGLLVSRGCAAGSMTGATPSASTEVERWPSEATSSLKSCGWLAALSASSIVT